MIDELYLYSCANDLIKAHAERKALGPSPLRDRSPLLPKQIMSWYTYSHPWRTGGSAVKLPHSHEGALREGLGGAIEKEVDGPSPLGFDIA